MGQWFEEFEEVLPDYVNDGLFIHRATMIDLGQICSYADTTKMNKDSNDCSKSIIYLRGGRAIKVVEGYDTITDALQRMSLAIEEQKCQTEEERMRKAWAERARKAWESRRV